MRWWADSTGALDMETGGDSGRRMVTANRKDIFRIGVMLSFCVQWHQTRGGDTSSPSLLFLQVTLVVFFWRPLWHKVEAGPLCNLQSERKAQNNLYWFKTINHKSCLQMWTEKTLHKTINTTLNCELGHVRNAHADLYSKQRAALLFLLCPHEYSRAHCGFFKQGYETHSTFKWNLILHITQEKENAMQLKLEIPLTACWR